MDWYWWVLIGVGVVIIGYLKLKVFKKITQRSSSQNQEED
jgi:hypothetical protein